MIYYMFFTVLCCSKFYKYILAWISCLSAASAVATIYQGQDFKSLRVDLKGHNSVAKIDEGFFPMQAKRCLMFEWAMCVCVSAYANACAPPCVCVRIACVRMGVRVCVCVECLSWLETFSVLLPYPIKHPTDSRTVCVWVCVCCVCVCLCVCVCVCVCVSVSGCMCSPLHLVSIKALILKLRLLYSIYSSLCLWLAAWSLHDETSEYSNI